jgi:hypothetical protein
MGTYSYYSTACWQREVKSPYEVEDKGGGRQLEKQALIELGQPRTSVCFALVSSRHDLRFKNTDLMSLSPYFPLRSLGSNLQNL